MAQYLNLIGSAQIPVYDTYELGVWQASGLLDGDMCIDADTNTLYWYNFDLDTFTTYQLNPPSTYVKQYASQTGALIDPDLVGLIRVIGVFLNGSISFFTQDGAPIAGVSIDVSTITGEVDPGYTWDGDNIIVQYLSYNAPTV
jgi:hypothetical protein